MADWDEAMFLDMLGALKGFPSTASKTSCDWGLLGLPQNRADMGPL